MARILRSHFVFSLVLPLLLFSATAAVQTTSAKKTTPQKEKTVAAKSTAKAGARKASPKGSSKAATASAKSGKKGTKKPVVAASSWRNRQTTPTPERYREIQQALYEKGYLRSSPSGVWDNESAEAMKQFQSERKLTPTGKINAPSLIDLGLGPKHDSPVAPASSAASVPGASR